MTKRLSIIVPCYNEAECIAAFYDSVVATTIDADITIELVFVDDGSRDNTYKELLSLESRYKDNHANIGRFNIVQFSRNFGKESALLAGLRQSSYEYVGIIDADLQQDPKYLVQMLEYLTEHPDCDCVAAVQAHRKEPKPVTLLKSMFYKAFNLMTEIDIQANASDFRVFSRGVANALIEMKEYHRFSKGLFSWVGFNTDYIEYEVNIRYAGNTSWSVGSLFKYAMSGITSFSARPLKLATGLGILFSILSIAYFLITLINTIRTGSTLPGYPTLICVLLLATGIQLFTMGIMGEYIGLIYIETKHRPVYITKNIISVTSDNESKVNPDEQYSEVVDNNCQN